LATTLSVANVRQFQLNGSRIGILRNDGSVAIKTGINGAWTTVANADVARFQIEGNRIGLLGTDGSFRVRDGMRHAARTPAGQSHHHRAGGPDRHRSGSEDVGSVAFRAGGHPFLDDRVWYDAVRPHFDGRLVVGRDLMEL
jgi:hypothetical protein